MMWKYIFYEIKSLLKTSKIRIIFFLILIMTIVTAFDNYQKSKTEEIYGLTYLKENYDELELDEWGIDVDVSMGSITTEEEKLYRSKIEEWRNIIKKGIKAAEEKDWKTYNEMSLLNGVYEYKLTQNYTYRYADTYKDEYHYYTQYNDEVERIIKKRGLSDIEVPDISNMKDDLNYQTNAALSLNGYIDAQYAVRLFDVLLDKDISPINHYQVDSVSIFFHTFNEIIPFIGLILVCILGFDMISRDKETGVIKTIISSPKMRKRYIISKSIISSIISIIVLLLPTFFISLCLGLFDKFKMFYYPTLTFIDGLHSFDLAFNNIAGMEYMVDARRMYSSVHYSGLVRHSLYGGDSMSWTALRAPDMSLDYISLGLFLLFALILFAVFIIFLNSLTMCINLFVKSKTLGLCFTVIICLVGYVTTPIENTAWANILNPFSYKNAVEVVAGTSSYPFFAGIIILLVYICLLQIIGRLTMRKKDMV
ncbi:MAG: ABC transporter permease subunit [Clostridium sp.]